MLKTAAYLCSIIGLALLTAAAWMQAEAAPMIRAALAVGAPLSIVGLVLRLAWHCREMRRLDGRLSGLRSEDRVRLPAE